MTDKCRLQTPQLEEALKGFPLYSQDGKGKEAICRAIFAIGSARWFILEGEREDGDTIMFGIAIGLLEDEYGYVSLKELSEIELNLTSYGFGILQVTQVSDFKPTALKDIKDYRLQELLTRLED